MKRNPSDMSLICQGENKRLAYYVTPAAFTVFII